MKAATAMPEVKTRLEAAGGEVAYMGTADFTQFLSNNAKQWADAVKLIKTN
jgi:tripartite-type tricarboxylate transporter receptor subunit TctC